MKRALVSGLMILLAAGGFSEVKLAGYFGDSMVVQRDQPIPVWGQAAPGSIVRVLFSTERAEVRAGDDGRWMVMLPPMPAGGPFCLGVTDGQTSSAVNDVMVGEVWLCGGQSNMVWPVKECANAAKEIAAAQHPWLRLARVGHAYAEAPREEANVRWDICTPETVKDFGAAAYYFGRELADRGCAVAVVDIAWGGSMLEAWMPQEVLNTIPSFASRMQYFTQVRAEYDNNAAELEAAIADHRQQKQTAAGLGIPVAFIPADDYLTSRHQWPSYLYNSIIYPLRHVRFRGIIFYQGEANAARAAQYRDLFPAMIRSWRSTFDQADFPFLFAQLAGFRFTATEPLPSDWAELREAQSLGLREPSTAMIVTIDIGDRRVIHPPNKQDVGKRFARAALDLAYKQDVVSRGPHVAGVAFNNGKVTVKFDGAEDGLVLMGDPRKTFAIAGEDQVFWWAKLEINGNTAVLHSTNVPCPVAVRYNWADYPLAYLYSRAGLPAEPFRTDDWPGLTDGRW